VPDTNLEVIAVDDRSSDDTGALIDAAAALDPRIRPLHIDTLPEGWLGKGHAMHRGVEHATGEWLLFIDADVRISPDTLQRVLAMAVEDNLDHVTLLPRLKAQGWGDALLIYAFGLSLMVNARLDAVEDPTRDAFVGLGAFNLVRRSRLDQSPGLSWLRLEIADDMGLGLLIKQAGGRTRVASAIDDLRLRWYPGLSAMIRGLEKNLFAVICRFSLPRAIAMISAGVLVQLAPWLALAAPQPWIRLSGILALAISPLPGLILAKRWHQSPLVGAFSAVGQWLLIAALIRSTYVVTRAGGVAWRNTWYPVALLREHQRVNVRSWGRTKKLELER